MKPCSLLLPLLISSACGSTPSQGVDAAISTTDATDAHLGTDGTTSSARTIFVIPLENKSDAMIYGNTADAPYINGLLATAAHATNLVDELPTLDSEPHYIWMEAGTNVFSDHTFSGDTDASMSNSTASTEHLVTQLATAGITWTAYQEGITTGSCPIATSGDYAPKHGPFVFFRDVSGSPPSATNAGCGAHYKAIGDLGADVQAGTVAHYAFITPNQCHDMHGGLDCPSLFSSSANIKAGDTWLAANLPPLIAYTHTHDATIFLVWDEGDSSNKVPFIAIGDHVVAGTDATLYSHSSMLRTVEALLGVPALASVASATDLRAMFAPGYVAP